MEKKSNPYVPIKIPKTLADEMDSLIGHFGYKTRAEIAKDGIRMVLRQFMNANPACEGCGDPAE
jgi:metal-responsive CopG/Arc/MetJ family transcriptional regulator